jgi:hypothetical protein
MKAQILKTMISDGKTLQPGDIVDVSGWRHAKTLASNRYIKIVDETAKVEKPVVEAKIEKPAVEAIVETPVVEEKPKVIKKKVAE